MTRPVGETTELDLATLVRLDERSNHLATKYFVLWTVDGGFIAYTTLVLAIGALIVGVMNNG